MVNEVHRRGVRRDGKQEMVIQKNNSLVQKTIFIFNKNNYDIASETQSKMGTYNSLRMAVVKNFSFK